jgi:hypothetical protein
MAERLVGQPQEVERLRLALRIGISYKRLHGWEPSTVQRGYDRDGNRVALAEAWEVVTEVESEWDDQERSRFIALGAYEADICKCGFHKSLTSDKRNHFTFVEERCPVCAGVDKYDRIQQERDSTYEKSLGDSPMPGAQRPADGRSTFTKRMTVAEVAAARADKS